MKQPTSLILAAAGVSLACALFWSGGKRAKDPPRETTAEFVPALMKDDLPLLGRQVGDLRLNNVPLTEVLRTLADKTKVNIFVDWPALKKTDVDQTSRVQATITHATLGDALSIVFNALPRQNTPWIGLLSCRRNSDDHHRRRSSQTPHHGLFQYSPAR